MMVSWGFRVELDVGDQMSGRLFLAPFLHELAGESCLALARETRHLDERAFPEGARKHRRVVVAVHRQVLIGTNVERTDEREVVEAPERPCDLRPAHVVKGRAP